MAAIDQDWPQSFFEKRKHIEWRANDVCRLFQKHFSPKSVIDVGCGTGEFVLWFQRNGVKAKGIEGTENCLPYLNFANADLEIRDITKWQKAKEQYDLVMCFMVVGRLPEQYWNIIAWNLASLAQTTGNPKGVILTVVENEPLWTDCMKTAGFYLDETKTFDLRYPFKEMNKTAVRSFANHLQVFRRMF